MTAFSAVLAELGCTDVRTYIQSGNAVVTVADAATLSGDALGQALEHRFGFAVPAVVRTSEEWQGIVANNPLLACEVAGLHVVLLAERLSAAQMAVLLAATSGEEKLVAGAHVLYLHLPAGAGRSRLAMACVGPKMPLTNTMRNWATVLKLSELLESGPRVG